MQLTKLRRHYAFLLSAVLLFTAWTIAAMTPLMSRADQAITLSLQRYASPKLDAGFFLVGSVGDVRATAILASLIGILLIRTGRTRIAVTLWALFVGGSIVELIGKHWMVMGALDSFKRPDLDLHRVPVLPPHTLQHILQPPHGYPSGHAFRALLIAVVGWTGWRPALGRDLWRKRSALITGVALMGVALVYKGDHRASEVIGGYLLGIVCVGPLRAARGDVE